jgi:hypothetical protein
MDGTDECLHILKRFIDFVSELDKHRLNIINKVSHTLRIKIKGITMAEKKPKCQILFEFSGSRIGYYAI